MYIGEAYICDRHVNRCLLYIKGDQGMNIKGHPSLVKNSNLLIGNKFHWGVSLPLRHSEPYLREFCSTQLYVGRIKLIWFITNNAINCPGCRIPVVGGKEVGLF